MKKLTVILLLLALLLALPALAELEEAETGDIVTFGRYGRNGGADPEPIEWIVLDRQGLNMTLISRCALDKRPFNDSTVDISYDAMRYGTSLFQWLNGAFADGAFTPEERAYLEPVDGQPVALLTVEEANRYFSGDADRICAFADSAAGDSEACVWWLGSAGNYASRAAFVRQDGTIDREGLSLTLDEGVRPVIRLNLARTFGRAEPGERVRLDGAEFDLRLFTMAQDNWDLLTASTKNPFPAMGEVYLLRFALDEDAEAMTPETIENEIAPAMRLYAASDGDTSTVFEVVTPGEKATRKFDILFYCKNFHAPEDLELLCDGVFYPLDGLPRDGEKLPLPTAEELAVDGLNALHKRAINESGASIDEAACTGDVIVAYYTGTGEDATPEVLTAGSGDSWDFPREYRAESLDAARWAAIIYPTKYQVGWYTGIAGGAANRTTTWLSLFDLQTEKHYSLKVAVEDPSHTTFTVLRTVEAICRLADRLKRE